MAYALLEKLNHAKLPHEVQGDEVNMVQAYLAAGLVDAAILMIEKARGSQPAVAMARVFSVTPEGRKTLAQKKVRLEIARLQGSRR